MDCVRTRRLLWPPTEPVQQVAVNHEGHIAVGRRASIGRQLVRLTMSIFEPSERYSASQSPTIRRSPALPAGLKPIPHVKNLQLRPHTIRSCDDRCVNVTLHDGVVQCYTVLGESDQCTERCAHNGQADGHGRDHGR